MRKNKNAEAVPTGTPNSLGRGSPHEGKKHSASHKNLKERLIEYETLAKKTK